MNNVAPPHLADLQQSTDICMLTSFNVIPEFSWEYFFAVLLCFSYHHSFHFSEHDLGSFFLFSKCANYDHFLILMFIINCLCVLTSFMVSMAEWNLRNCYNTNVHVPILDSNPSTPTGHAEMANLLIVFDWCLEVINGGKASSCRRYAEPVSNMQRDSSCRLLCFQDSSVDSHRWGFK